MSQDKFAIGTRVRILVSHFKGETGTVNDRYHDKGLGERASVKLDSPRPHAASAAFCLVELQPLPPG